MLNLRRLFSGTTETNTYTRPLVDAPIVDDGPCHFRPDTLTVTFTDGALACVELAGQSVRTLDLRVARKYRHRRDIPVWVRQFIGDPSLR